MNINFNDITGVKITTPNGVTECSAIKINNLEVWRLFLNSHEYVDLGLPSGTLWATCNLGASSPEEAGDYYQWAGTTPCTEETTSIANAPYSDGTSYTKYNDTDDLTELEDCDDAEEYNLY